MAITGFYPGLTSVTASCGEILFFKIQNFKALKDYKHQDNLLKASFEV